MKSLTARDMTMDADTNFFLRYPRTRHLAGSRHGAGDSIDDAPFAALAGRHVVVEEKLDGANTGIRFDPTRGLLLQSRGHELAGGPREAQFELFKQWAHTHTAMFADVLGTRFVAFGEWMYAAHTVFYDTLAHYWYEFDVFDRDNDCWLDTPSRHTLWAGTPVVSVPVLTAGSFDRPARLVDLVGPSLYISADQRARCETAAVTAGDLPKRVCGRLDLTGTAEGLYVKVEDAGSVVERFKWVRPSFTQAIADSASHWADRPIVVNGLADGVTLWGS